VLSQLDKGLLESVSSAESRTKQVGGGATGGLAGVVGLSGKAELLWANGQTETRTLHDHIYNLAEDALKQSDMLVQVPGEWTEADIDAGHLHDGLGETDFVLVSGHVVINEFAKMREFLNRFNEIGRFLAYTTIEDDAGRSKNERDRVMKAAIQENGLELPAQLITGMEVVFDVFYRDRVVVKIRPLATSSMSTFAGVLRPEYLREPIDTIVYKYGLVPPTPWRMLAQVAAIPKRSDESGQSFQTGGDIEQAMMSVFESMREVQAQVQCVSFPEIAVTPVALYRE